jgi:hypothetical protein
VQTLRELHDTPDNTSATPVFKGAQFSPFQRHAPVPPGVSPTVTQAVDDVHDTLLKRRLAGGALPIDHARPFHRSTSPPLTNRAGRLAPVGLTSRASAAESDSYEALPTAIQADLELHDTSPSPTCQ